MWLFRYETGGVWFCADNQTVWKLRWQRLPPVVKLARQSMPRSTGDSLLVADSAYSTYVDLASPFSEC